MAQCWGPVAVDITRVDVARDVDRQVRLGVAARAVDALGVAGERAVRVGEDEDRSHDHRGSRRNGRRPSAAPAARIMLSGWPGTPASITTTGRWGRGVAKNAGGTHTYAGRATKPDTVPGMVIVLTTPSIRRPQVGMPDGGGCGGEPAALEAGTGGDEHGGPTRLRSSPVRPVTRRPPGSPEDLQVEAAGGDLVVDVGAEQCADGRLVGVELVDQVGRVHRGAAGRRRSTRPGASDGRHASRRRRCRSRRRAGWPTPGTGTGSRRRTAAPGRAAS